MNAVKLTALLQLLVYHGYVITSTLAHDKPIIGVLSQKTDEEKAFYGNTYIAASYVKFLESSGARVVPILVNQSNSYYQHLFNSINGALLPGGDVDMKTSGYGKAAKIIYDLAVQANNADDPFPIWGTCMGFQLLTYLTSGENLLTDTNSTLVSYPLYFQQAYKTSKLFGSGSAETGDIINILSKENVTFNAHFYGITPKTFNNNTKLRTFYRMLTTNYDDNGKEFVSMIEAFKYPFYGAQWHPEKNNFEFVAKLGPNLHHSADAIKVTLYMAQFFVNEARKSSHKFKNATEEAAALIYNFPVVYTAGNTSYEQCYFF